MKKIIKIGLLSVLSVAALAACGEPAYEEKRTEVELISDCANQIIADLGVQYAKFSNEGLVYGKNELTMTANQKEWDGDKVGLNFTIAYTLAQFSVDDVFPEEFVKFNAEHDALIAELVLADDLILAPASKLVGGAAYILTAEVKFNGYGENFVAPKGLTPTNTYVGQSMASKSWNALAKTTKSGTITEVKETAQSKDMVLFYGRVYGYFNPTKDELYTGLYVGDGDDGVMLYAGNISEACFDENDHMIIDIGDTVMVYGQVSPYNGLFEVKPSKLEKVDDPAIIANIEDPVFNTYTGAELNALEEKDTGRMAKVNGLRLITDVSKMSAGDHLTIKAKDDQNTEVTIYLNYHYRDQKTALDVLKGLNGGAFNAFCTVSSYNGIQLSPAVLPNDQAAFVPCIG